MFPQRQKWVWTSGAAILIAAWVPNFSHQAPWHILDGPWPSCMVVLESAECRRRSDLWLPSAMEFWFCDSFIKYLLSTCHFPGTSGTAWTPNQSEHREDCIMAVKSCHSHFIPSVQFSPSVMSNSLWPMDCSRPGFPVHHQLMSIESVMPSNHLILCLLSSIFPSIRVFSNESVLYIRWPKYWSFSFSVSPSNEYSAVATRMEKVSFYYNPKERQCQRIFLPQVIVIQI